MFLIDCLQVADEPRSELEVKREFGNDGSGHSRSMFAVSDFPFEQHPSEAEGQAMVLPPFSVN